MNLSCPARIIAILIALGAPGSLSGAPVRDMKLLAGKQWVLKSLKIDGNVVPIPDKSPPVSLEFGEDGKVNGRGPVNAYFGSVEPDGNGGWKWGRGFGATRKAGPQPLMALENRYFRGLAKTTKAGIEKGVLTFATADGKTALAFSGPSEVGVKPEDGEKRAPNIVFIMSDELAYYELSHMGNRHIKTPRIDRMAAEGIRFTRAYAGSPVCAPLRCTLMTGMHSGHASVRANDGGTPLRAEEPTIATVLKAKGYATGGFGKWGCGGRDSTGVPEKHGFDVFYGYYDQVHAHSFYPPYLVRNSEEIPLEGNVGGRRGKTYSHYEIMKEGLDFIRDNKEKPFFCYLPITPPHGMYDIPPDDPAWEQYKEESWIKDPEISQDAKNYAAMVTMVDNNVGQVLDLLKELRLEENTVVFFTGDNGGQDRFKSKKHPRGFFGPNVDPRTGVEFRGGKGNLYEGGLRIPFIVRWPGKIRPQVSDLILYQPDVFPTLARLAEAEVPDNLDGVSFLPALLGGEQKKHAFLYWEFGNQVAVRTGDWKGIYNRKKDQWELFDLKKDISETTDLATRHPEVMSKIKEIAEREHSPVRKGTYTDRTRHERDRWAKWGDSKDRPQKRKRRRK